MSKKKRPAAVAATFIPCYLFWLLLTMSVAPLELIYGLIVCGFSAWLFSDFFVPEDLPPFKSLNPVRWVKMIGYVFVFLWELIKANIGMVGCVFSGKQPQQAIVKVPVNGISDYYGLAMLSDSITLTPGTITMDVAQEDDKTYMYIQWINMETDDNEKAGEIIKGRMERWIGSVCK